MTRWLLKHRVDAAVMKAVGVKRKAEFDALDSTGVEPMVAHAQHVKQIKGRNTGVADSA